MSLDRFFEVRAASQAASDRAHARRVLVHWDKNDPELQRLEAESLRLYKEAEALTGFPIRANLERFGIPDIEVVGVLKDKLDQKLGETTILLSELCARHIYGLLDVLKIRTGEKVREVRWCVTVMQNGVEIGYVRDGGQFHYHGAPDLRTCVGWAMATDLGRERILDCDLNAEVLKLTRAITSIPTLDSEPLLHHYFFDGPFHREVVAVMDRDKGSRYGNGYCYVLNLFWQVGTRTLLGQEHPGYDFLIA